MELPDHIIWTAPNGDHPARRASQRSYAAVGTGVLEEWLKVYAEDAVIEDPVRPSWFDPEGKGHHGHEGISAFMPVVTLALGVEPRRPDRVLDDGVLGVHLQPLLEHSGADGGVGPLRGPPGRVVAVGRGPDDVVG